MWADIKARARRAVHLHFSYAASYVEAPGASAKPTYVRLHNKAREIGDLDREGYAKVYEDINAVILDSSVVRPRRGAVITFEDGTKYMVENPGTKTDLTPYVRCEVARVHDNDG